ncbi:unnamed protein product [Cladocopium goreaui]|uniref:Alpha/beta hydrolase domain-containing protein aho-3 (Abnormal hunger orientation protein 3) n=1 Tax=Cladocopium goreaui TaxID=2562237 RepID=A0A9P1DR71_9DINO|nr:unnamed protein product [Cladocopium goreaui]
MWVLLNSQSSSWNVVERLIFPAPKVSYTIHSFPRELILIPRQDGAKVPCLFLPFQHARFLFIYFHANAEDLGLSYGFCKMLRDLFQVHVLAVEYPGYGICPGSCDEAGIMANAHAAFHFATETLKWPKDGIKLFGRSLGTGPTVQLAAKAEVAGVILISPFTSIRELFRGQIGQMADFLENRFPNLELTPKIRSPTLIIHGLQDSLVSPEHGRRIYASIGCKRMIVTPHNMSHNTSLLKDAATFILPMTHFFSLPDYSFEELSLPSWVFPAGDADLQSSKQRYDLEWFPPMCTHSCIQPRNKEEAMVEPISRLKACHGPPEDAEAEVRVFSLPAETGSSAASPTDTDHDWTDASGISAVPTDLRTAPAQAALDAPVQVVTHCLPSESRGNFKTEL